jgi:hypothetical protein
VKTPSFPLHTLFSRTRRLAVPAGVTVILVGFFIVALIGGGPGSDEAPPFNGQILRKNFEPTGIATVITVRALGLPADQGYRVEFSDWQTGDAVLDAVILGERTSQFALPHAQYRVHITPFVARNGVPRDRAPSFATASPFIVGASKERKTELSFDVARALGVPRTTGQATRLTSKPTGIEK